MIVCGKTNEVGFTLAQSLNPTTAFQWFDYKSIYIISVFFKLLIMIHVKSGKTIHIQLALDIKSSRRFQ